MVEQGRGRECGIISRAAPGHLPMRSRRRRPWQTLHTDTGRQKQTAHSDSISSGNFGSHNPYIFSQEKGTDFGIFVPETGTDQDSDL